MTHSPRTKDNIYTSLRDSLKNTIAKLTNFTDRSFNYVWTQAFAEELRELEVLALTAELSGFIDYTGGPVTEDDLKDLGVASSVDAEDINEVMEEQYLDEYVKLLDITRDPGTKATGTVEITTQSDSTNIPKGTVVTTEPDEDGKTLDFVTLSDTSTSSGATTTSVDVEAEEVGAEYNLPANTIVRFEEPPVGVLGVTNPNSTSGGQPRETNSELRERTKEFVRGSGRGGTKDGIKQYIATEIDSVETKDIGIDQFTQENPPFVDVVVDNSTASESDLKTAIDESRPTGIEHNLVDPTRLFIGVRADVVASNITDQTQFESNVESDITNFLENINIQNNMWMDELVEKIMESDERIEQIEFLDPIYDSVEVEQFIYETGKTDYVLRYTYEDTNGTITIEDDAGNTYSEGTDFTVIDDSQDNWPETIRWDTTNSTPNDGQPFFVNYDVTTGTEQVPGRQDVKQFPSSNGFVEPKVADEQAYTTETDEYLLEYSYNDDGSMTVTDDSGDSYSEGTDFTVEDQNGDGWPEVIVWDTSASTPDQGEMFTAEYTVSPPDRRGLEVYNTNMVRDEVFEFNAGKTQSFTYSNNQDRYTLREPPYLRTISVKDDSGDTYNEDTDYVLVDENGDGYKDTIDFSMGKGSTDGSVAAETPDDGENFTVTYDQTIYDLEEEAKGVLDSQIRFERGTDITLSKEASEGTQSDYWRFADRDNDGEYDAIYITGSNIISDGTKFYLTYQTDGDVIVGGRDKIRAGSVNVNLE